VIYSVIMDTTNCLGVERRYSAKPLMSLPMVHKAHYQAYSCQTAILLLPILLLPILLSVVIDVVILLLYRWYGRYLRRRTRMYEGARIFCSITSLCTTAKQYNIFAKQLVISYYIFTYIDLHRHIEVASMFRNKIITLCCRLFDSFCIGAAFADQSKNTSSFVRSGQVVRARATLCKGPAARVGD
jgi:hypothetical protein